MYNNNRNYKHHKKAGKPVNTFTIENKTYSIRLSEHAELRLKQRNIDLYQAIGSILSLGKERITDYAGSNRDIFIMDNANNFSVVCNIEYRTITIITVIDKADCYIKDGTIAINL
jgi:hypothetical protein